MLGAASGAGPPKLGPGGVKLGIRGWWDFTSASYLTLTALAGDDRISAALDRSLSGKHLAEVGTDGPIHNPNGEVNNLGSAYGNSAKSRLSVNLGTISQPFTVWCVAKTASEAAKTQTYWATNTERNKLVCINNTHYILIPNNPPTAAVLGQTLFQHIVEVNNTTSNWWKDDDLIETGDGDEGGGQKYPITNPFYVMYDGTNDDFCQNAAARFFEIAVWDRVLTTAEKNTLSDYAESKYSIPAITFS